MLLPPKWHQNPRSWLWLRFCIDLVRKGTIYRERKGHVHPEFQVSQPDNPLKQAPKLDIH